MSLLVAVGFACSFVAGFFVVKTFLDYVSRHGFALFAWWRVIVGCIGLIAARARRSESVDQAKRPVRNWPVLRKRQR